MASYDFLTAYCTCPRCRTSGTFEIEAFFPSGGLFEYNLGDELINLTKIKLKENFIAEGYTICPYCDKDFFVNIQVRNKTIYAINISDKKGYIDNPAKKH
jgi:hypothetical protein